MSLEDLVLMPEVDARRVLGDRPIALSVLAPVGSYAGRGRLRVLRVRPFDAAQPFDNAQGDKNGVELVCGYEAYDRI